MHVRVLGGRGPGRGPRWLAVGAGSACVVLAAATLLLFALPVSGPGYETGSVFRGVLAGVAYGALGAVVAANLPGTPVGWLMLAIGASNAVSSFTGSLAHRLLMSSPGDATGALLHWVAGFVWVPGYTLIPSVLLLYLPDGSPPSPRWRWVGRLALAATVLATLAWAVTPYDQRDIPPPSYYGAIAHPVGIDGAWAAVNVALVLVVLGTVLGIASLVLRLRSTTGARRDQLVLCLAGAVATVALLVAAWLVPAAAPALVALAMVPLPAAITYAMLRRRLWEFDVVLNRSLVYATLTLLTLALYGALVALLSQVTHQFTGGSDLLVFVLAAVAVQPLKDRVQRGVNRLLYGQVDEPYAAVSRLAERLETASSPSGVLPNVVEVVARTLLLPYVRLQVPGHAAVVFGQHRADDELVEVPLTYSGRSVGQLLVAVPPGGLGRRGQQLLEEMARHTAVATHAARLQAELQRSREQIVTSREEERRRLRHDLHDDLGPGLAATAMQLEAVADLVEVQPARAVALLHGASAYLRNSVADVRRIVDDLQPAALADLGLVQALDELAERLRSAGVAVGVSVQGRLDGLSAAVEVAAYRITAEALANVAKHSGARNVEVRLSLEEGALVVRVADDGVGLPAQASAGVGLRSMHQRATELGGSCSVAGDTGGTTVLATLPLNAPVEARA